MSQCPLEIPQCKRKLMTTDEPFKEKQCPLNVKPQCCLVPPACPMLPQQDSVCGLSKFTGRGESLNVLQCPAKSPCILAPAGCPVSLGSANLKAQNDDNDDRKFPDYMPRCPIGNCINTKKKKTDSFEDINSNKCNSEAPKSNYIKKVQKVGNKCPVSSTVRPLPCAECILGDLSSRSSGNAGKGKTCPFLRIADMCGPLCKCVEVPEIDSGPRCPFLPKPCPCCSTPRCPLTKEPDCPLKPKPLCQELTPPCYCGTNCLGETITVPSFPSPHLNPPRCLCGGCPLDSPCSFTAPKCVCGTCPVLFSCCPPKPCKCVCGLCPIGKILCSVTQQCPSIPPSCPMKSSSSCPLNPLSCPLNAPSCPLNPPSCPLNPPACPLNPPACPLIPPSCSLNPPSCPLNPPKCPLKDPCPLLKSPICPPIPPPCSLNKYELQLDPPKSTFHVPICPQYKPLCEKHLLGDSDLICPFSPHPCPLGTTCPFPITNPIKSKEKGQHASLSPPKVTIAKSASSEGCPGSTSCGLMPHPECPAAEILCPEKYKKKVKPKKEPCPLKECMRKPECPLSKAMPNIECPMKDYSDCPMSKEPDCPVVELSKKCPIVKACPGGPPQIKCLLESESKNRNPTEPLNNKSAGKSRDCPLSNLPDCLKGVLAPKPKCPLLPKIDCPLASKPDCPLAQTPGCPLTEYTPKSDCPMASIACPLTSSLTCPLTTSKKFSSPTTANKPPPDASECVLSKFGERNFKMYGSTKLDGTSKKNEYRKTPSNECPLMDFMLKQNCPLAPPPCPLTPKPKCPLTKKPDPCPLSLKKPYCPVEYPPCGKFPYGRCPMGRLNICDCDYPISPCLFPLQEDVVAPPQYCIKENCCMGLGPPPIMQLSTDPQIQSGDGYYYQFMDTKPGKEETKHYVQIMTELPKVEVGLIGKQRKRLHNNWNIIKYGEGFKRCKTIAKKLEEVGPLENRSTQYLSDDCELGPDGIAALEFRKKHSRELAKIKLLKESMELEL